MKYFTEPARAIPVIEADVFVAGAGTAGCIAAIAAAREGAKVVLVEKLPVPCGTLGNGGNGLSSFYNAEYDAGKAKRIVGGLAYEFMNRCVEEDVCAGLLPVPNNRHAEAYKAIPNREGLKAVFCMMLQEAGVQVYLQTMLAGVYMDADAIQYAILENKDGRTAVQAKMYIDCTGDGDIAKYAGVEQVTNWQIYDQVCGGPNSLPFGLGGIDFDQALREASDVFMLREEPEDGKEYPQKYWLKHVNNPERCKNLCAMDIREFTSMTSFGPGEATFVNNSKGVMLDASTAENLTKAEMEMRIRVLKMTNAMKKDIPGFQNCHMIWEAIQLGIRSSKITVCDKMLTSEEVLNATRFDDEIGLYGFQDMVEKDPSTKIHDPGYYGFPYRMLLAKGCANLFMAGRCVTHDLMAHNSTRNTVGAMIMGQGAGVAAGLCVKKNCMSRELPYQELRQELLNQGVILSVD